MTRNLASDQQRLSQRTFSRHRSCAKLIDQLHGFLESPKYDRYHYLLETLLEGLITPYTTWKADFKGFAEHVCRLLKQGKRLSPQIVATIQRMADVPPEPVHMILGENERGVKRGTYDPFLSGGAQDKFKIYEGSLLESKEFQADFAQFLREWDVAKYYDDYKVLRRTPTGERNFHPPQWYFRGKTKKELFEYALDIFCGTWELYGIEDRDGKPFPLLQKLSINATANGLMLFIPSYWSFDFRRDINWKEFNKLQKARCGGRIGSKSASTRMEYNATLRRVAMAKAQAKALQLTGAAMYEHIRTVAKLAATVDDRVIRRWIAEGKDLL